MATETWRRYFKPSSGTLSGVIHEPASAGGGPAVGAPVDICASSSPDCFSTMTNGSGAYSFTNLLEDDYSVFAEAPASGPEFAPAFAGSVAVDGVGSFTQDLTLGEPLAGPPPGTTISPTIATSPGGVPTVFWDDDLSLATMGCATGTASYTVDVGGTTVRSGSMTESPTGSGNYVATVPALVPIEGIGKVTMSITGCASPSTVSFDIYIDPSGVVKNASTGAPIAGATVTLLRSDSASGPFTQVPNGSAIMSPGNRTNPDTTNGAGHFGWDVVAGFYKVQATATGCNTVESPVLTIPPAVTDLELDLTCSSGGGGGGGSSGGGTPVSAPKKKCKKAKKGSALEAKKKCKKAKKGSATEGASWLNVVG